MFEKWTARKERLKKDLEEFETTHETVRKAHQHVVKHQMKYACGATAVVCIGGTRMFGRPQVIVQTVLDQAAPVAQLPQIVNTNNVAPVIEVVTSVVNHAGHCCKIIQDAADPKKMWPMVKDFIEDVAEENNTTQETVRRELYRYWAGNASDVFGHMPFRYGVTTTS